jgi:CheY-like chemotaxis protein
MNRPTRSRSQRRRAVAPPAALPHRSNGRSEALVRAHVLVVDDHSDTRDLLVTILKTEGYDVSVAEDGAVAVDRYRQRRADIVLMDLYMPRKDGVTAIRELRGEFPDVVIVAMSGDAGTVWRDALAEARSAGAQLTLRKPIEPWVLLRALVGLVAARRSLQAASLHRSA